MEISELSKDLTIMFIRGNGSPRSFRLRVSTLQKWLLMISLLVVGSLILSGIVSTLYLLKGKSTPHVEFPTSVALAPTGTAHSAGSAKETPAAATSLWDNLKLGKQNLSEETQKELAGLRADNAKLNAQIDSRKPLDATTGSTVIQLLGPNSAMAPDAELLVEIKNTILRTDGSQVKLDFELHNKDPQQTQIRGYILVLAKSADAVYSYPAGVFSKKENILVDFTKGETFAISRFRQAQAVFERALDLATTNFQILLVRSDGKVLASMNVEGKKS